MWTYGFCAARMMRSVLSASLAENPACKAGDDDVQFGEQVVVEIQLVLENVHLGAGEQAEINALVGELLVDLFDFLDLLAEPGGVEAVRLEGGFGMVGDGPIVAAEVVHVAGDGFDGFMAVAPVGMIVERAAQLGPFDEAREFAFFGGGEFAVVLAQFRRDVGEVELRVNFLLGLAGDKQFGVAGFLLGFEEAVFVEAEAALDGALAQDDVVFLAAGEIEQGVGIFGIADDAQIRLDAAGQNDGGLGFALSGDAHDFGRFDERFDDLRRFFRRGEKVNVADGFAPASQTACDAAPDDVGMLAQHFQDRLGHMKSFGEQMARGVSAAEIDAFENFGLGFFAEAIELRHACRLCRRLRGRRRI